MPLSTSISSTRLFSKQTHGPGTQVIKRQPGSVSVPDGFGYYTKHGATNSAANPVLTEYSSRRNDAKFTDSYAVTIAFFFFVCPYSPAQQYKTDNKK